MTEEPTTVAAARPTETQAPPLELMVAAGITAIPQVGAFLFGGYGHLIAILPVALALTLADIAAVVVAAMQLRADRHARRPTHWLVWITLALAAPWILYVLYIGVIALMVQIFCINQTCRGPIR
ncbi:MAG: hypothetical protein E6H81_00965 [Chloroflexi bacterium]|nr:MAG: hypothetical protein E6H81_00965 [Chloroflexota bacterium]